MIRGSWMTEEYRSRPGSTSYHEKSLPPTESTLVRRRSSSSIPYSVASRNDVPQVHTPITNFPLSFNDKTLPLRRSSSTTSMHLRSHSRPRGRPLRTPNSDTEISSDGFSSSETEELLESVDGGMKRLTLRGIESIGQNAAADRYLTSQFRFHGKSSSFALVDATRKLKEQHIQEAMSVDGSGHIDGKSQAWPEQPQKDKLVNNPMRLPEFWRTPPVSSLCRYLADEILSYFHYHLCVPLSFCPSHSP